MEPIRVEDILRPTDNSVPIIGKVQQIWGPKRIAVESEFECGECGYICIDVFALINNMFRTTLWPLFIEDV